MRRFVLPLAVFVAIGAVILILVKSGEEATPADREPVKTGAAPAPGKGTDDPFPLKRAETPTPLERNRWLSELERALGRADLSHALYFRGKVCQDLDTILQDSELTRNLLNAIRTYGIESDDPRRRDVVLPILRVLRHPAATKMIAEEYYRAKTEREQIMLLEAMSHDYHDPEQASVWAVERALNSETEAIRNRAFEVIKSFSKNPDVIFRTATQIYDSSTRPPQKLRMIDAIGDEASFCDDAQAWLRKKLHNPQPEEIGMVVGALGGWADENDAARVEALALEFPELAEVMRERARQMRQEIRNQAGQEPEPEPELPPKPPEPPRDE
jgi:hypothetical protein